MRTKRFKFKRQSGGFAILEALVGLLVMVFGMVALASFQSTLSLHSDIAKQRSEATRIAQHEIDTLRAFRQRAADLSPGDAQRTYLEDLGTAADRTFPSPSGLTNATFTVSRAVTIPAGDRYRWVRVAVTWPDRSGQTREVVMNTVVSDGDPGDLGALGVGRTQSTTLRPRNRNINIPYPAVTLDGGQLSAFIPPPGNVAFVFDNVTGEVVNRCTDLTAALTEGSRLVTDNTLATCDSTFRAYLLSGYVRFKTGGAAPTASNIDDPSDLIYPTLPLLPDDPATTGVIESPLAIDSRATGNAPSPYECYSQQQKTVRYNSAGLERTVPEVATAGTDYPTEYNLVVARFIAYTCIVTPIDHDSNLATAKLWSGEVTLVPYGWSASGLAGEYRVCRASGDYNRNAILSNHEHPRYYRHVTGALDNQNYLVIKGDDACPPDVNSAPIAGDFLNTNTAKHQPSADAELSFWCTGVNGGGICQGKTEYEPTSVGLAIPME